MLNIGVSGETIASLFEDSRGDVNTELTARKLAPVKPPDASTGVENGSPAHARKLDPEYMTSKGCAFATSASGAQSGAQSLGLPGNEVRPGDRQPTGGTRLKYRCRTTWRKTLSIDSRGPSAFSNGDRARESASIAVSILAGVLGSVEVTPIRLTSACGSVGSNGALCVGPTWRVCGGGVGDLDRASGDDEG